MPRPANSVPFFRVWTPEMAYVLGYWWADGCMRIKRNTRAHEVSIASNDREHVVAMANVIGANYVLKKVAPASNTYVVEFCGVELYTDLLARGGTPRKSAATWMPEVPPELLPQFVVWSTAMGRWRGMPASRSCTSILCREIFVTA